VRVLQEQNPDPNELFELMKNFGMTTRWSVRNIVSVLEDETNHKVDEATVKDAIQIGR
jgi:hypothetical protein